LNGVPGLSGPHWRRVMAALANRDARNAYAQIVLGEEVLPGVKEQRRSRAIAVLLETGPAQWTGSKGLEASEAVFRELLGWIVAQAIQPGEDLSERQVNERLLNYADDVVLLRGYLVDFGLVERTASDSSYRRTESVLGTQD
jgi:hypothetical protein